MIGLFWEVRLLHFCISYNVTYIVFVTPGLHKRCIQCRSRGDLGSCGDPFPYNMTEPDAVIGIHMVACPSGWCGKLLQGSTGAYRTDGMDFIYQLNLCFI